MKEILDEEQAAAFDKDRDPLVKRLDSAFADLGQPDEASLHDLIEEADMDSYEKTSPEDRDRVIDAVFRTHWHDIDPEKDVGAWENLLYLVNPEGYRYLLPAMLRMILFRPKDTSHYFEQIEMSFIGLGFYFSPETDGKLTQFSVSQLKLFQECIAFIRENILDEDGTRYRLVKYERKQVDEALAIAIATHKRDSQQN